MTTRIRGLEELKRKLARLPDAQVDAARDALSKGAEELSAAIKRVTPHKTGALQNSVGWSASGGGPKGGLSAGDDTPTGHVLGDAGLSVKVHAGNREAYYARFVEYGTEAAPAGRFKDKKGKSRNNKRPHTATRAQPFFWPTVRASKKRVVSRVARNANAAAKALAGKK